MADSLLDSQAARQQRDARVLVFELQVCVHRDEQEAQHGEVEQQVGTAADPYRPRQPVRALWIGDRHDAQQREDYEQHLLTG